MEVQQCVVVVVVWLHSMVLYFERNFDPTPHILLIVSCSHLYLSNTQKMAVTLHTNYGDIKVEIFCDTTAIASENFLGLCASGAYDGTLFHRNIKQFMIQGGDPTGTGKGKRETIFILELYLYTCHVIWDDVMCLCIGCYRWPEHMGRQISR